ncbi:substrate-binding domain-containing protein [Paenarthrobacter sp. PAE-2]|uniref:substrate-binding domain-containing protein n=1 Tax=Paenarthrobacter sp. PAE-2 TaxID=2982532 RepID=UPI0022303C87|nr:substrate-binding domain-containing protein [Paenarthrobacter sp. PAE-2]MCW3768535.1 substrate-binding domain-containing protein [Paenarthrobacter sp. PAE-2]
MRAISSMATRYVLADLISAAVAAGLPKVELESVGGVDAAQRVADGEQFDLVFLAQGALQQLDDGGHVVPGSVTPLMHSEVAVAVPSGSDAAAIHEGGCAFPDAAGLRATLQQAGRIGYSTGPSGAALVKMIDGWGMVEELGGRLVQARPGIPVARSLAEGRVDLGFQQLSELVGQPGIRILGVLPPDCAIDTVFGGAVATVSGNSAAATEMLRFLASEHAAPTVAAHSFTPAQSHPS